MCVSCDGLPPLQGAFLPPPQCLLGQTPAPCAALIGRRENERMDYLMMLLELSTKCTWLDSCQGCHQSLRTWASSSSSIYSCKDLQNFQSALQPKVAAQKSGHKCKPMVTNGTPLINLTFTAKPLRNCIIEARLAPPHTPMGVMVYLSSKLIRIYVFVNVGVANAQKFTLISWTSLTIVCTWTKERKKGFLVHLCGAGTMFSAKFHQHFNYE